MSQYISSPLFQKRLLALLLQDPVLYRRYYGVFKAEYFTDPKLSQVARALFDCYELQKNAPDPDTILNFVLQRYTAFSESAQVDVMHTLSGLYELEVPDAPVMEDLVVSWAKNEAVSKAVVEAAKKIEAGRTDLVLGIISEAMKVGSDMSTLGTFLDKTVDGVVERLRAKNQDVLKTGLPLLDVRLGSGGLAPGEMLIWMGPPKGYKSGHLVNSTYHSLMEDPRGLHVTYCSLELSEDQIFERYCHHIAQQTRRELNGEDQGAAWERALKENLERFFGQLNIRSWALRSASTDTLNSYLDLLESNGHRSDLVAVDYGNVLAPSSKNKGLDSHHLVQGSLFEDLKGMAVNRKCRLVTAARTGREALKDPNIRLDMIAGSVEALSCTDYLVAIIKNEEMDQMNHLKHKILLNRNEEQNTVIQCHVNYGTHTIKQLGVVEAEELANKKSASESFKKWGSSKNPDKVPTGGSGGVAAVTEDMLSRLKLNALKRKTTEGK